MKEMKKIAREDRKKGKKQLSCLLAVLVWQNE